MKVHINWQVYKPRLISASWFALVGLIIALIAPIKTSSKYQYSKDKPWQGRLVTAPYDFPIYKQEEQLKHETDSIKAAQIPVYSLQTEIGQMMLQELRAEYQTDLNHTVSGKYFAYLNEQLQRAYQQGIIGVDEQKKLQDHKRLEVLLLSTGNVIERMPSSRFRTLGEIHERILKDCPQNLSLDTLKQMDVDRFIQANVVYNQEMSDKLLDEAINNLSPSIGIVQMGQRIIDRGEIVTPYIYNLLRSMEKEQERRTDGSIQFSRIRIGVSIICVMLMGLLSAFLSSLVKGYDYTFKNNMLVLTLVGLFAILTALAVRWSVISVFAIPYVMIAMLLRVFLNSYAALLGFITTILLSALFVAEPLSFIIIQMLAGMSALVSMKTLTSRGKMIRAAFAVYVTYGVAYLGVFLITDGLFTSDYLKIQFILLINLVFLCFTYILAFFVERGLGYVSNVSLVELSDINTPLLRELSEVAPGTFQHSLQVSILAADAARKIGASVPLVRAGALYHDIGKIKNPAYFTENQGGSNPHDLLTEVESALVITRHVTDGIALAQKHDLPGQIIDFIRTHHSTSLVRYFYNAYCNAHPGETVDPTPYTYLGPKPFTREQGILMLADATEASSRSLKVYSEETLKAHVDRIIDGIIAEGHLNDTPLTFKDIQVIKSVFVLKLKTMYHTRISYPDKL